MDLDPIKSTGAGNPSEDSIFALRMITQRLVTCVGLLFVSILGCSLVAAKDEMGFDKALHRLAGLPDTIRTVIVSLDQRSNNRDAII